MHFDLTMEQDMIAEAELSFHKTVPTQLLNLAFKMRRLRGILSFADLLATVHQAQTRLADREYRLKSGSSLYQSTMQKTVSGSRGVGKHLRAAPDLVSYRPGEKKKGR